MVMNGTLSGFLISGLFSFKVSFQTANDVQIYELDLYDRMQTM